MECHPVVQAELRYEPLAGIAVVAVAEHIEHDVELPHGAQRADRVAEAFRPHDPADVEQPDRAGPARPVDRVRHLLDRRLADDLEAAERQRVEDVAHVVGATPTTQSARS